MAKWLFKQEPECYSYSNLETDGETIWDGIANPLALKHLRSVKSGDQILFYHTGKERAIVGLMEAVSEPQTADDNPKIVTIQVKAVERFSHPLTLDEIKQDELLQEWDLVRLSRLSVVPISKDQWKRIEQLMKQKKRAPKT